MRVCDLTSPLLSGGLHGSSVAQEAPTGEAPQTSADDDYYDNAIRAEKVWQWIEDVFPDD